MECSQDSRFPLFSKCPQRQWADTVSISGGLQSVKVGHKSQEEKEAGEGGGQSCQYGVSEDLSDQVTLGQRPERREKKNGAAVGRRLQLEGTARPRPWAGRSPRV